MNVTVINQTPTGVGARTIGYWKNHDRPLVQMLAQGPINLGDTTVTTVAQAVSVLSNSSAQDARNALLAQLLATILNLRNGADPSATGTSVIPTRDAAIAFLQTHPSPVTGKHPNRAQAIALEDTLGVYNNSAES